MEILLLILVVVLPLIAAVSYLCAELLRKSVTFFSLERLFPLIFYGLIILGFEKLFFSVIYELGSDVMIIGFLHEQMTDYYSPLEVIIKSGMSILIAVCVASFINSKTEIKTGPQIQ